MLLAIRAAFCLPSVELQLELNTGTHFLKIVPYGCPPPVRELVRIGNRARHI